MKTQEKLPNLQTILYIYIVGLNALHGVAHEINISALAAVNRKL